MLDALHRAVAARDPEDAHPERGEDPRHRLPGRAEADDDDRLAPEHRRRQHLPPARVLVAQELSPAARERQHVEQRGLRHLRPVDAAGRGDEHVAAGDRALDELRPGEQRLDEPEPRHPLDDVRRQQQSVDGNAHRHDDLGVVEVRLRGVEALLRAHGHAVERPAQPRRVRLGREVDDEHAHPTSSA